MNRFALVFKPEIQIFGSEEVYIYSNTNSVYFQTNTSEAINGEITVFTIQGQKIASQIIENGFSGNLALNCNEGIYLVQLKTNGKVFKQKVFLKK